MVHNKNKTKVVKGFDPIWNEWFDFDKWSKDEKLCVEVMHYNNLSANLLLGRVRFPYPTDGSGHTKAKVPLELDKSVTYKTSNNSYLEIEIVNIGLKHKNAGMQFNVSPEEGEKLLARMIQGSDWVMDQGKTGKSKMRDITLFYSSDTSEGYPIGSIIWTSQGTSSAPKPSALSSKHVLAVHTITDVYIGPPCPHSSQVSGDKDLCLTFEGKVSFNLVAASDEILDVWLRGIRYAITSKKKKCTNVQVEGSGKSLVSATSWNHPANEAVQSMLNGCDMVSYSNEARPQKDNVFVFFSRDGGKYGSIYWSDGGKVQSPNRCILLHQLTDIYVGKQQKIFQGPIASGVEDQCCFSIVSKRGGKRISLHIQAESVEVMKTWMVGINHILTTIGRKVVLESETGEKKTTATGRRFSRHFSVAVRAKSTHPGVLKMADGAYFTRYRQKKSKAGKSVKTKVFVFHSRLGGAENAGDKATGALFWYEKATKDRELEERKKDRRCIPVQSITDIYCGKQHPIFQTSKASDAKDECVFSIKGAEVSKGNKENFLLHLEAESPDIVKVWMEAIAHLLEGGGRSVEQVGEGKDGPQIEGDGPAPVAFDPPTQKMEKNKKKRMSVAPPAHDTLDMLGFDTAMAAPATEAIEGFFPSSRPANPFDTAGEWDPFKDAPPPGGEAPPADDLSAFFGMEPTSPKAHEVAVLLQPQDSVWGTGANDPFALASSPGAADPFAAPSQPSGMEGGFGSSTADPFGDSSFADAPPAFAPPPAFSNEPTQPPPDDFSNLFGQTSSDGAGEMARFLQSIGLVNYVGMFEKEQVDIDALKLFSKQDLKDIGLPAGPSIKILKTLPNWKG